jgi:hypothetical protein
MGNVCNQDATSEANSPAPTPGHLWPIPVPGDHLEALALPVDPEWILEKPGRRFGYGGLPEGAGDYERVYERVQVLDVNPEEGTVLVAPAGGFSVLRYFAECRWPRRDSNARTWCPECGPRVDVDEDGLCLGCGATACGPGADAACDALEFVVNAQGDDVENWTTEAKTREPGKGALMFRGAVALEVGNGAGNMRRAAELAKALNHHGVVLAEEGSRS